VALVVYVHQIVVVRVHLDGRELTLVDDVPVAERAEVEPVSEADDMSRPIVMQPFVVLKSAYGEGNKPEITDTEKFDERTFALVDDVPVAERAEVEPVSEADDMSSTLS
jgi:hypothetical protein